TGLKKQSLGQDQDCRLDLDNLSPIIQRFNPYFSDHQWNAKSRIEMARLGEDRLMVITQDGCKRHHIRFTLIIDPGSVTDPFQPQFWEEETNSLLFKAYYGQKAYNRFGKEFENAFKRKFRSYGLNQSFNFPIGTRNFLCELLYDPQKGGKITIEIVSFIFRETIKEARIGIPREKDDGWKGQ
ncbi:MAG: hypothetical protein AAF206_02385, partial [Bacteroidota bacterium]